MGAVRVVLLLPGALKPTPIDRGIGPPFTDSARSAGDCLLEAPGVLFELLFFFEGLAQKIEQDLPVGFSSIRNPVKRDARQKSAFAGGEEWPLDKLNCISTLLTLS